MSYSAQPFPLVMVYTDADFRANFPYFADPVAYPEAQLQIFFDLGTNFVSNLNMGCLNGAGRQTALYLMTAHLQALTTAIVSDNGGAPGVTIMAQIDKIRVQIEPPPSKNSWQYWLNQTPWGQQLLALLSAASVGGFFKSGLPELSAFRRVGGMFNGGC